MDIPAVFSAGAVRSSMNDKPYVLIMCGGQSVRLWPLSEYKSKNFLDLFGFSPLEHTIRRFLKVTTKDRIFLVANQSERASLRRIRSLPSKNIFYEPASRNTAAAVLFALRKMPRKVKGTLVISPVDHYIRPEGKFRSALTKALRAAHTGTICTLGVRPDSPSVHMGYIQAGMQRGRNLYEVHRFVEKPSVAQAKRLLRGKKTFFNCGLFIAPVRVLWEEFERWYPFTSLFCNARAHADFRRVYRKIPAEPFDKVIMEKTRRRAVVHGQFSWKDFGSWHTVYELLKKDSQGNALNGNVCAVRAKNNCVYLTGEKKKLLLMGLEDVFVIDTPEHTFIAHRQELDNLKATLRRLNLRG
ncbi:MAG: hypothetical protein GF333_07840 [Candidatus Omnitrophica bacterium]|nr:hypothetical protein [Candidatus Omnitrophota bacterium]